MFKSLTICPNCLGTRAHVKLGGQIYREGAVLKIPEDFGEVYECPDCRYHGVNVIEGNESVIELIKFNRQLKQYRDSRPVAPTIETPIPSAPALELNVLIPTQ